MGWELAGLSTFDPFSDENVSQVDTKTRLGSKFLPANPHPIQASIFSSSCYGFANSTAHLLVHSGWVKSDAEVMMKVDNKKGLTYNNINRKLNKR